MTALRLPELFHIGWVVRDCDAAQQELAERLGVGPFISASDFRFDTVQVHGEQLPLSLRIAFGTLGGVVIELLQPLDDNSPHAEFLAAHGEGPHHLAFIIDDFDEQLAAAHSSGLERLVDGTGPGNPFRWVYLDAGRLHGTVIELWERTPVAEAHPALALLKR